VGPGHRPPAPGRAPSVPAGVAPAPSPPSSVLDSGRHLPKSGQFWWHFRWPEALSGHYSSSL